MPETLTVVLPWFAIASGCGGLLVPTFCAGNVIGFGFRLTNVPRPETAITCGLLEALSRIEIVPDFWPKDVGAKVTFRVQVPPGLTLPLQVEFTLKGLPAVMEEIVRAVGPILVSVTAVGGLEVPTS